MSAASQLPPPSPADTPHLRDDPQKTLESGVAGTDTRSVKLRVRTRLAIWILAIVATVAAIGAVVVEQTEAAVLDGVERDLSSIHSIESIRVDEMLAEIEARAMSLAAGPHVQEFTDGVVRARAGEPIDGVIGGRDGFSEIDPSTDRPLDELTAAVLNKARVSATGAHSVAIVSPDGSLLGASGEFQESGITGSAVDRVLGEGDVVRIGSVFPAGDDVPHAPVVSRIRFGDDTVGALVVVTPVASVLDFVEAYEIIGATSEVHLAQPTVDGDAQFITPLRFNADAAFEVVVPETEHKPINDSLSSPSATVLHSPDYRGVESILVISTVARTGWGLVVKIDRSEALEPVATLRNGLLLAGAIAVLVIVAGWALLVMPIGRRLRRTADAATRIADGDLSTSLTDPSGDEIGDVARSIDRLASDLASDMAARAHAEAELRHRADHDGLTGVLNRQAATRRISALVGAGDDFSVVFVDVDRFKAINDTHGHQVGDEVLQAIAGRIAASVAEPMFVARWGGDEFLVVVPSDEGVAPAAIVGRLEGRLAHPVSTSVGPLDVAASLGTADRRHGDRPDDVVSRADHEMFRMKRRSRRAQHRSAPSTLDPDDDSDALLPGEDALASRPIGIVRSTN